MMHDVAERCVKDGGLPHRFIGEFFEIDGYTFMFNEGHADCMVADLYDIRETFLNGEVFTEIRVPLEYPLGAGESGTADIVGRTWRGVLHVEDWKFGEGIIVEAEMNFQGMLYAAGALQKIYPEAWENPTQRVVIRIRQPRVMGGGSTWETTVGFLRQWCEEVVVPKIAEINEGRGVFQPGEKQCRFCKARLGNSDLGIEPCAAYQNHNLEFARKVFGNLDLAAGLGAEPEPTKQRELTPEIRVWLLDHADMFKDWLADLADQARADLERGRKHLVPGKKLVLGRSGPTRYKQPVQAEVVAERFLGDEGFERKLRTPTQMKDRLGEHAFDLLFGGLYEQPAGRPVIVDESNPKPAIPTMADKIGPIPKESE